MDTPKSCAECDIVEITTKNNTDYYRCSKVYKLEHDYVLKIIGKVTDDIPERPDWCPLKPVPDRINLRQYVDNTACNLDSIVAYQYAQGWNSCIDKVLEGEKE